MRPSRYAADHEWERYLAYTAEQSAAEEGEHALIVAQRERWAREAREREGRYDGLAVEEARSPISRYLSGSGSVGGEHVEGPAPAFPVVEGE